MKNIVSRQHSASTNMFIDSIARKTRSKSIDFSIATHILSFILPEYLCTHTIICAAYKSQLFSTPSVYIAGMERVLYTKYNKIYRHLYECIHIVE